jgi:hypothetical protein
MRLFGRKNSGKERDFWLPFGGFNGSRYIGSDKKRYELISVLEAVINKRAECFSNAMPYIVDSSNNEPQDLAARRVRGLFDSPSALMSFQQLYRITDVYRMLYGYCVWFTPRIEEGSLPSSLLLIPPDKLSIEVDPSHSILTNQLPKVKVRISGQDTRIPLDDLIIFNDIKTGFGGHPLLAQSRMTALCDEVNLLGDISEAQSAIIKHRGALGVLTRDPRDEKAPGVFEENKKKIQEEYRHYGLSHEQWKIIITSAPLRWIPLTMNIGDLKLIELEEAAAKKVCSVYDIPYELFPLSGNSTFENRKQAKLELYQDHILPTSAGDAELITKKLGLKAVKVSFDYSHLPVFQEDQAAKASTITAISTAIATLMGNGTITKAEARTELSAYMDINPSEGQDDQAQEAMLAQEIGVGGTQSMVAIVTDPNLTDDQKRGLLMLLFNLTLEETLQVVPISYISE